MSKNKIERKYKRIALTQETAPRKLQSQGVPAKLLRGPLFNFMLCHAVLKDISVGGAGVLVPSAKEIPDKVRVSIADKLNLKARVVRRQQISEELMYLGIVWAKESHKSFTVLTKLVSQLSQGLGDSELKDERKTG